MHRCPRRVHDHVHDTSERCARKHRHSLKSQLNNHPTRRAPTKRAFGWVCPTRWSYTICAHPTAICAQPTTRSACPTRRACPTTWLYTISAHPTTRSACPTRWSYTISAHPTTSRDHPTTSRDHPTTSRGHPTTTSAHPTTSRDHPTTSRGHPTTSDHPSARGTWFPPEQVPQGMAQGSSWQHGPFPSTRSR
jgi:hypothetical protein